ncbi:MAG: pyridoxal phosphate-dependent aminotransferase [Bacteroidota bacterium]
MLKLSQRSRDLPDSPIRKLAPYAEAAKAAGRKVYHLNIGQPDLHTPPAALQRLRQEPIDVLAYCPSWGVPSYRQKIPDYFAHYDIHIEPEDILVTTGASEAIFLAFLACLDPGDEIIVPEPFYANYLGFAAMADIRVVPVTSYLAEAFALPPVSAIEAAITPRTRAILLCNPNNPTGGIYTADVLQELATIVRERQLFLMVDEVYREFVYTTNPFRSALQLEGLEDYVIVIDSISKRYSACGARVGTLISRNRSLLQALFRYAQFRLSPPGFGQIFAEAALDLGEAYLEGVVAEYDQRRRHLYARLSALPDVKCYLPQGAFYLFAELPIDNADRFCQWLLESFQHEGQTLMLAPGSGFYATPGLGEREVRIAYILQTADLDAAMDCLDVALRVYPGRRVLSDALHKN